MKFLATSFLALAAALLIVGVPTSQAATVLHHYSFDSDFTDDSGNVNTLTASSGTPNIPNAGGDFVFGTGALNLDQSGTEEHLAFASAIAFDGTSSWSVSWWSQRNTAETSGGFSASGGIIGTISNSDDFIFTPNNVASRRVRLRSGSGATRDFSGDAYGLDYEHFAVSYDDNTGLVSVWREGILLGSPAWGGNIDFTHVGAITTNQAHSFHGRIDELYIFNGTLSNADVASLKSNNALAVVPEPHSYTLALIALAGLVVTWRHRRR